MDYILPSSDGYTIYSKSGCPFCVKAKKLLTSENPEPIVVDCDEYLLENKVDFLNFIKSLTNTDHKTFPMIFHKGTFIGGFTETKQYYEKTSAFDNL
jgi:glutaredoxin